MAVTAIEDLIAAPMLAAQTLTLARDTVFAAIKLILNGIVGLCSARWRPCHHEQRSTLRG